MGKRGGGGGKGEGEGGNQKQIFCKIPLGPYWWCSNILSYKWLLRTLSVTSFKNAF